MAPDPNIQILPDTTSGKVVLLVVVFAFAVSLLGVKVPDVK